MYTIDVQLFRAVNNLANRFAWLDAVGTFVATYFSFVLAAFLVVKWFQKRKDSSYRVMLLLSIITFVISEVIAKLFGKLYEHVQPFAALPEVHQLIEKDIDNSFPSDHTVLIFSFMIVLFLHTKTKSRYVYLLMAILAGLSRIFVGVHYPSDVIVGAMIAVVVGCFCYYSLRNSRALRKIDAVFSTMEARILREAK